MNTSTTREASPAAASFGGAAPDALALLDALPAAFFCKDAQGRYTYANDRFCASHGRPREAILGRSAAELFSPEEAERHLRVDERVLASGEMHDDFEQRPGPDGQPIFVHVVKQPLLDATGRCIGVQGMFLDVTRSKRAEAQIVEAGVLLRTLLDHVPDSIFFKDRASRFMHFSRAMRRKFGFPDDAPLRGKCDAELFTAEHAEAALADEQRIIATGESVVGKLEKETHPDGHVTWALTTKLPWRDDSGAIVGTFGISQDATALKLAEEKLAYERELLRTLLDSVPDTIYFKDLKSRFVRVSRSKVRKTLARVPDLLERRAAHGLPPAEEAGLLNGLTDFDTFAEADARLAYEAEQEIIRTGQPLLGKLEKQFYHSGSVQWCITNKLPWRDTAGNLIGTFGLSKDVTDLKLAEERAEQLHRQLLDASRQAGMAEVATGVLHNVGNVLNSINVSATLVADQVRRSKSTNVAKLAALVAEHRADLTAFLTADPRGQMIPEYLSSLAETLAAEHATLLDELDHLRKNVEHTKEIVAMQQAYASVTGLIEPISIADVAEDALRINAGSLTRHDVRIIRDYQARPVAMTDRHKVLQILINLLRNAQHACDESGRADKQVEVRIMADDAWVRIELADNGVGIPLENLTRIFAHGFTTRRGGHGFGLHISALAAKELKGTLTAQSDGPGHGATFTLTLPLKS